MQGKKILLFGLGLFQRQLILSLLNSKSCIIVDTNKDILNNFCIENPKAIPIDGEASSIVTWKKINTDDVSHIVSSVQDYDVVIEICRITREVYNLQIPLLILWHNNSIDGSEFEKFGAKVINPMSIGIEAIENIIDKNYTRPSNIGLGLGEIVEVSILRRSHIVDRKMRYLRPSKWRVAAAYREGRFIVPDGDFQLQVGDRAVLIGDPKVIENIVNILMKGTPEFPLQYGQVFGVLADNLREKDILELFSFNSKTKSRKFLYYEVDKQKVKPEEELNLLKEYGITKGGDLKNFRGITYIKDLGLIAISAMDQFSIGNFKMRYFFKKSPCPFLITRGVYPYSEVLVSFNSNIPDRLLELVSEISALFDIPFKIVYVVPPKALKTQRDEKEIKIRKDLITDYENLTRHKVEYHLLEGNPVKETLNLIGKKRNMLLIVSADSNETISLLNPHVPFLLAARSNVSVLVVPDEQTNE